MQHQPRLRGVQERVSSWGSTGRRLIGVFTFLLVLLGGLALPAFAEITLVWDFDHGALDPAATTITPTEITLGPRSDIYISRWIYCRASGMLGQNPEFRITNNHVAGYSLSSAHRYVYSYDQEHWQFFDQGENSSGYYRFRNDSPFTQDTVWLAYSIPYPWAETEAHMDGVSLSSYVSPTPTADANFVLGYSNDGTLTDAGRAVPQLPMYGYRISDTSAAGPKSVVMLTTGNHPNETTGSYTFNGMVDFILSSDPRANALRQVADFYVYPNCNPDGRWAGHARSNPEVPNVDHNRDWDDPVLFTDLTILTAAMKADTSSSVDYFIDFHSFNNPYSIALWLYAEHENIPFVQGLVTREPTMELMFGSSPPDSPGVSRHWAHSAAGLNAEYTFTPESGFIPGWQASRYELQGRNYGLAMYDALVIAPCASMTTNGITVWADDFDAGTSGFRWDLLTSSSDFTADFACDYGALGIPPAPNSTGNTTVGVKFTVNKNDTIESTDAVSAFPNDLWLTGDHVLRFDAWLGYGSGSGTTEFMTAGLLHGGSTVCWPEEPASDGVYFAVTGEGGASVDYRVYVGPTLLDLASGAYVAGSQASSATYYQTLFPAPEFPTPGAPGKHWVAVELRHQQNAVTWSINGTTIARVPDVAASDGTIMLGLMDVFASVANPGEDNFVIYDNVRVEQATVNDCNATGAPDACEPIGAGDMDIDGDVDADDLAYFVDCLAGPARAPVPMNTMCASPCLAAFDFDADGDVDARDFAAMQQVVSTSP